MVKVVTVPDLVSLLRVSLQKNLVDSVAVPAEVTFDSVLAIDRRHTSKEKKIRICGNAISP